MFTYLGQDVKQEMTRMIQDVSVTRSKFETGSWRNQPCQDLGIRLQFGAGR